MLPQHEMFMLIQLFFQMYKITYKRKVQKGFTRLLIGLKCRERVEKLWTDCAIEDLRKKGVNTAMIEMSERIYCDDPTYEQLQDDDFQLLIQN